MRRIWFIYFARKSVSSIALQTYGFAFIFWQMALAVSMPHIFANMPSIFSPARFISFHINSFMSTEPMVQLLAIGSIVLVIWLGRSIMRNVKGIKSATQAFSIRTVQT
jgi:hypothetical protein